MLWHLRAAPGEQSAGGGPKRHGTPHTREFSLHKHETMSCLESAGGRMLSRVVSTISVVRREWCGRTRKERGAALSPSESQGIGKEWRTLVVLSGCAGRSTKKRKGRLSEAILNLRHKLKENTKRRQSCLSHRKDRASRSKAKHQLKKAQGLSIIYTRVSKNKCRSDITSLTVTSNNSCHLS